MQELERMKQRAEAACQKLERDIQAIKQQKVGACPAQLASLGSSPAPLPCALRAATPSKEACPHTPRTPHRAS
jgi:hypothetical protein